MTTAIIAAVFFVVLALILFIARRAVRLFVRLALVGVLLVAMLLGIVMLKWYGAGSESPHNANRPTTTRRTPSH